MSGKRVLVQENISNLFFLFVVNFFLCVMRTGGCIAGMTLTGSDCRKLVLWFSLDLSKLFIFFFSISYCKSNMTDPIIILNPYWISLNFGSLRTAISPLDANEVAKLTFIIKHIILQALGIASSTDLMKHFYA